MANIAIVEEVYLEILERPADAAGLASWVAKMNDPNDPLNTKEELIASFRLSEEYINEPLISLNNPVLQYNKLVNSVENVENIVNIIVNSGIKLSNLVHFTLNKKLIENKNNTFSLVAGSHKFGDNKIIITQKMESAKYTLTELQNQIIYLIINNTDFYKCFSICNPTNMVCTLYCLPADSLINGFALIFNKLVQKNINNTYSLVEGYYKVSDKKMMITYDMSQTQYTTITDIESAITQLLLKIVCCYGYCICDSNTGSCLAVCYA